MLSHINGATNRAGIRELEDLESHNALLLAANDQHKAEVARLKSRLKFMEEKTGIVNEQTKAEIARMKLKVLKKVVTTKNLKKKTAGSDLTWLYFLT